MRRSSSAPVSLSDPKTSVPLVEGQVGGHQDGAPLVALAEDLGEEFRPGGGQGMKPSSSTVSKLRRKLPLQIQRKAFAQCLHQFKYQDGGSGPGRPSR